MVMSVVCIIYKKVVEFTVVCVCGFSDEFVLVAAGGLMVTSVTAHDMAYE